VLLYTIHTARPDPINVDVATLSFNAASKVARTKHVKMSNIPGYI